VENPDVENKIVARRASGRELWQPQLRDETVARALANSLQAAITLAELSNSPDLADRILEVHQDAVRRVDLVERKAAA
jgi:hypothetical protein